MHLLLDRLRGEIDLEDSQSIMALWGWSDWVYVVAVKQLTNKNDCKEYER